MWAWIPKLLSFVPLLGGLFEKWTEQKGRTAEIRAEKELVEAKAFSKGRIVPKYLVQYAQVVLFVLFSIAIFVTVFFPSLLPDADLSRFRELIEAGEDMAGKM